MLLQARTWPLSLRVLLRDVITASVLMPAIDYAVDLVLLSPLSSVPCSAPSQPLPSRPPVAALSGVTKITATTRILRRILRDLRRETRDLDDTLSRVIKRKSQSTVNI